MQYKQLPPNPSLEHLKSQAKQLLKGHKEGSLAAFQRIQVNPLSYCFSICPTGFCSRANFMRRTHEKKKVRI